MPFIPVPASHPDAPLSLNALIAVLPADDAHPPQTLFDRAGQVRFLDHLSINGSARGAARAAGVSHQTVYRMRRGNREFRRAWAAAMLLARPHAEAVIGDRAIDGIEEEVWFRGEVVGTRRRYDTRLLLAHIGRLDRLEEDADAAVLADDFDMVLDRVGSGQDLPPKPKIAEPVDPLAETNTNGAKSADSRAIEPCNMRSMSAAEAAGKLPCKCPGAAHGIDDGQPHFRMTARGPEPVVNLGDGTGPCCDRPAWPGCRDCPHYPVVNRIYGEMEEHRPVDAPPLDELGDPGLVEDCQMEAFEAGDPEWWRMGEDRVLFERDGYGDWQQTGEPEEIDGTEDEGKVCAEPYGPALPAETPSAAVPSCRAGPELDAARSRLIGCLQTRGEDA